MPNQENTVPNKIRKINHETAVSPAWNAFIAADFVVTDMKIQSDFDQSFQLAPYSKSMFPAELSQEKALPAWKWISEGVFSAITSMLAVLSPVAIAFLWINVWTKTKDLYYADNKNIAKIADLSLAFLRASVPTILLILAASASTAVLVYAAPIVVGIVLGISMIYGAIKLAASLKRAYAAYKERKALKKNAEQNDDPKKALKNHLVSIIANAFAVTMDVLGFVMNYYLGKATQELESGKQKGLKGFDDVQVGVADYLNSKRTLEVLTLGSVIGMIPVLLKQAYNSFKKTTEIYADPAAAYQEARSIITDKITSLKEFWNAGSVNKVLTPFVVLFEIASLAKSLVLNLIPALVGLTKGLVNYFSKNPSAQISENVAATQAPSALEKTTTISLKSTDMINEKLSQAEKNSDMTLAKQRQAERAKLVARVDEKIAKLSAQTENEERKTKRVFLESLKASKLPGQEESYVTTKTIDDMVKEAKKAGPGLFKSLKVDKGEIEEITDAAREYENKWYSVAGPAA